MSARPAAARVAALAGSLNSLQEEVTAKDKALKESQSRVADLEKQIRDMQRLLDLKQSAATKAPDAKVAAAAVPAPVPAPAKVEPVKAPEPAKASHAGAREARGSLRRPSPPRPPKRPRREAPKQPPKKAAAPPPPPPKEWYEDLIDPMYLALGGAASSPSALIGFLFMRRRKARAEAGPNSAMTSAFPSDLKPSSTTGKAGGRSGRHW